VADGLLRQLGLSAPAAWRDGSAAAQGADPVVQQHQRITASLDGIADAARRAPLAQELSRLRATHEAGKTLRDPAQQARLRQAELAAAGQLLDKARQAAKSAAPAATAASPAVAAPRGEPREQSETGDRKAKPAPAASATSAAPAPSGKLPPDLETACDKYLQAHGFKAIKRAEIVPGDMQCDVSLDGRLVDNPAEVSAALLAALPALKAHPIALAQFVRRHWDLAVGIALALAGNPPRQTPPGRQPPDGLRRRQLDGEVYWEPNPAPSTWGTGQAAAPAAWMRDFFVFYGLGADASAGNDKSRCLFDGKPSTLDAAVSVLQEQAPLSGYRAGSGARAIAEKLCTGETAGRQRGANIADNTARGNVADVKFEVDVLADMPMPDLLAALETIRAAGQLDRLALMKTEPRLGAAIRAVQRQLDATWEALMGKLEEEDAGPIRRHAYGRIVADPAGGAARSVGKGVHGLVDQIEQALQAKRDLKPPIAALQKMDMRSILDVLEQLHRKNRLEDLLGAGGVGDRIGAAALTVRHEWDGQWERVVATLEGADRDAILERSPADRAPRAGKVEEGQPGIPTELGIGIVFVPKTVHRKVAGEGEERSVDLNTVQAQGTYTFKFHGKGQHGFEGAPINVQGGLTYDEEKKTVSVQLVAGGQAAAVLNFLKEAVQVQAFVQALAGVTLMAGSRVATRIVATGQVAAGGQVVLSHPDILGGNLKLILLPLQVSGTATGAKKGPFVTTDVQAGIGLQVSF
jgi:hypothetical protein